MAFTFPSSPATNDTYTVGSRTYTWTGSVWEMTGGLITTSQLTDLGVTTAKINDLAVTAGKIASGAAVTNIGYTPANTASPTFTGTVVLPSTTSIGTVSNTEIGYVDGVTSAIQTQLDSKLTATTDTTSNRNVVINGGFDVWQRGTTSTTTGNTYLADRWIRAIPTGGTQSQETDVPSVQYRYSWKQIATATNAYMQSGQQIEFQNCKQFQNQATTISFWAKAINSNAGSTALVVRTRTIAGVDGSCIFAGTNVDTSVTLTTSWVRYTVTRTMPATFGAASIELVLGSHLSGDGFFVTGLQWELGSVATPFEFEDFGDTLRKCMRYYQKSFRQDIAPATATSNFDGVLRWQGNGGGFGAWCHRSLPVIMRSAPVVTLFNPVSANAQARNTAAGVDIQTCTAQGDTSTILTAASGTNDAASQGSAIHYTLSSEL
jgi:hypothetical protein